MKRWVLWHGYFSIGYYYVTMGIMSHWVLCHIGYYGIGYFGIEYYDFEYNVLTPSFYMQPNLIHYLHSIAVWGKIVNLILFV